MISAALLALIAATGGDRPVAAFVSLMPRVASGTPPRAALLEGVDVALRTRTALSLRSSEQLGLDPNRLDDCPRTELLGCITEHVAARSSAAVAAILTLVPQGERRHRVALTLVDMGRARAALARVERGNADPDARAAVEDAIFSGALVLAPTVLDASAIDELSAWVTRALDALPHADDAPSWLQPLATLTLDGLDEPMTLTVDGAPRGSVSPTQSAVTDVAPGPHRLELSGARSTAALDVTIAPGEVTSLTLVLMPRETEREALRTPLLIGGGAAAAAGVALAMVSAISAASVNHRCIAPPGDTGASCAGLGWPGFGLSDDALPTLSSDRLVSGPPLFPIGAGLFGAGVALIGLETVARDPERSLLIDAAIVVGSAAACALVANAAAP